MISKELSLLDGLPFQQRSKVLAVTVVKGGGAESDRKVGLCAAAW